MILNCGHHHRGEAVASEVTLQLVSKSIVVQPLDMLSWSDFGQLDLGYDRGNTTTSSFQSACPMDEQNLAEPFQQASQV